MVKMGAREFVYPNFRYRSRWLRNRDPVYGQRNLHCDVVHITTKGVSSLTVDCNGVFAIKAYRDWLNSDVRTRAKWIASSLIILFGIWSGPLALYMSSPLRSFRMPPSEISRFEILGRGVPGRIGVPIWSESRTKTDSNC